MTDERLVLADFDSPGSFDYDVLTQCIQDLKDCKAVQIPNYSFVHHSRLEETTYLYGAAIVIGERRHCPVHELAC